MSEWSHQILYRLLVLALFCQLTTVGCAANRQQVLTAPADGPVWPENGEMVRIRFLGSFSMPEDLKIQQGMFSRIWDLLVGTPGRRMVNPNGISADDNGTLFVVDAALKRVHIYNRKEQSYSSVGNDDLLLSSPVKPLFDPQEQRLYVTDSHTGLIHYIKPGNGLTGEIGKGVLERPTGIAVHPVTNELLVLDTRLAAVFRFNRHDLRLTGRFGVRGTANGQFNHPTDLSVNQAGEILVSDSLNFRVQVFSADGHYLRGFGKAGDSPGYFSRPKGIASDSDNNIYVVDGLFDNVQIFDREGRLLLAFGRHGQGPGEFWMPSGIHIDRHDRIYVADTHNKRVQVFQYQKQGAGQ